MSIFSNEVEESNNMRVQYLSELFDKLDLDQNKLLESDELVNGMILLLEGSEDDKIEAGFILSGYGDQKIMAFH